MRCYECDDFFEDDEIYCRCCYGGRGSELSEARDRINVLERRVEVLRGFLTDLMAGGCNAIAATLDPPPKPPRRPVPVDEALLKMHQEREAELDRAWGISVPHKIPHQGEVE